MTRFIARIPEKKLETIETNIKHMKIHKLSDVQTTHIGEGTSIW